MKTKNLTSLQEKVLRRLRALGDCDFIAAATERHWRAGEPYSRCNVGLRLRKMFDRGNEQAERIGQDV